MQTPVKDIARYYSKKETKWGYTLIMHDSKHLGWYPHKKANISEWKAQENYQDKIAECLHLKKEQKVLDGGCGRGVIWLQSMASSSLVLICLNLN
jgi:cyclopropane fatty-acyl-phospholipid synthase-like methyltransferase